MRDSFNGVIRARHFGINCLDIEKSLFFYREILGFKVKQDYIDDSPYIGRLTGIDCVSIRMIKLAVNDGFVIELVSHMTHLTRAPSLPVYTPGLSHLALEIENSAQIYQRLVDQGVHVFSEPLASADGIAKVFFCSDPDDVRIELVEIL